MRATSVALVAAVAVAALSRVVLAADEAVDGDDEWPADTFEVVEQWSKAPSWDELKP